MSINDEVQKNKIDDLNTQNKIKEKNNESLNIVEPEKLKKLTLKNKGDCPYSFLIILSIIIAGIGSFMIYSELYYISIPFYIIFIIFIIYIIIKVKLKEIIIDPSKNEILFTTQGLCYCTKKSNAFNLNEIDHGDYLYSCKRISIQLNFRTGNPSILFKGCVHNYDINKIDEFLNDYFNINHSMIKGKVLINVREEKVFLPGLYTPVIEKVYY